MINYTQNEKLYSKFLIFYICLGVIYCSFIFNPFVVLSEIREFMGFILFFHKESFVWVIFLLHANFIILFSYWALKSYIYTPFEIQKYARIFLLGIIISVIIGSIFFMLSIWIASCLYISQFLIAIGFSILTYAVIKEPKILYVLPFTLYQMKIRNKRGTVIFQYEWAKNEISDSESIMNSHKEIYERKEMGPCREISLENLKVIKCPCLHKN